jgi:hypothetical protein
MIKPQYYLDFLSSENCYICTEPINSTDRIDEKVLNSELNWEEINSIYEKYQMVVVDNFLKDEYVLRLRKFKLFCNYRNDIYYKDGYEAIDYYKDRFWFPLLSNITDEIKENAVFLNNFNFERAWSFIYENNCSGVGIHADPSSVNCNLWVTPVECLIEKENHNGLNIWPIEYPKDWNYNDYNGNPNYSLEYINKHKIEPFNVGYKHNRCIFFNSNFFHQTQPVISKDGHINKRINYTFLYK